MYRNERETKIAKEKKKKRERSRRGDERSGDDVEL